MALFNYNTVTNLKATTGISAGDTLITNGYHSVGDGGNAEYAVITSTATDDGGSIISFDDSGLSGLRAQLLQDSTINVKQFGAKGDDSTDDRIKIQNAINFLNSAGGGNVHFPEGTYVVSKNTAALAALDCRDMSNLTFSGDNIGASIIKLEAGTYTGDTYLFNCNDSSFIQFTLLTLDGNKSNITTSEEQMHGIHSNGGDKISCDQVKFSMMVGDGVKLIGVNILTIRDCQFINNGRSGITVQHSNTNAFIENNYFSTNSDQSIDFEPTSSNSPAKWMIRGNIINHTTNTTAVALTGRNLTNDRQEFFFQSNLLLNGAVFITNTIGLHFDNNTIIGDSNNTALELAKDCRDIIISNNYIENNKTGVGAIRMKWQSDVAPQDIKISNNQIKQTIAGKGIEMIDIHGGISIQDNTIENASTDTSAEGIYLDTNFADTVLTQKKYFFVDGNTFLNFGTGYKMTTFNTSQKFDAVVVTNNLFTDNRATPGFATGVSIKTPSTGSDRFIDVVHIEGNTYDPAITTKESVSGVQDYYTIKSGRIPTFYAFQDPEGTITAPNGSTVITSLAGANKTNFIKSGGAGNTGWRNTYYDGQTILIKDLFSGSGSLGSHTPNIDLIGNGWVENDETWQVSNGEVRTTTEGLGIATLETEFSNCEVSMDFWTVDGTTHSVGIVFRYSDNNNYWRVMTSEDYDTIWIQEISSGTVTTKTSIPYTIDEPNIKYNLNVKVYDELVVVDVNGTNQFSYYGASFNKTATKHGLFMTSSNRYRISNFYLAV